MIYLCLLLSGGAGLAYEVLWMRLLGLYFGHTVYAVTTVLAAFMGGLALGSFLFGRLADRIGHPLRLYGILELGTGWYCLAAPALLSLAHKAYIALYPSLPGGPLPRILVQFALASAVLIVPATFMGGTLPVVAKGLVGRPEGTGRKVALIYGTNTLGAALGAFAAGYWLLPTLGNRLTNHLGVAATILAGALALLYYRRAAIPHSPREGAPSPAVARTGLEKILLWGFALSGAVAMSYQIAWVRALILVIGNSAYAFSAILVTFLFGIALGSYLFSRIRLGATPRFFAGLQLGIALSAFLLIPFFNHLPRLFLVLFAGYESSFNYILFIQFLIVFLVVLPPTIFMGMTFPCLTGILSPGLKGLGRDVGRFYAYNTLGAIAGALLTGFFLIPYLGSQKALALGVGLNLLVATVVLSLTYPARRRALVAGFLAASLLLAIFPPWNRWLMNAGISIYPSILVDPEGGIRRKPSSEEIEILFFREGVSSTVAVTVAPDGNKALHVNGKVDAGTSRTDMSTQVNLAYFPMILHPNPQRVAVIGLGSGVTAGIATLFQEVESIEVVELEPAVVEGAGHFAPENFDAPSDPRVTIRIDDGRSYLEGTPGSFDIIISEPSNPWISGVAALFSAEFMDIVRKKLSPGGLFCQWMHTYSISPEEFKIVIRSFLKVFPESTLWKGGVSDYLLIGGTKEAKLSDLQSVISRLGGNPRLAPALVGLGYQPVEALLTGFALGPEELRSYAGEGPLNTDDLLLLEFRAPKSLYTNVSRGIKSEILGLKRRPFPSFLKAPWLETAESSIHLGEYLLLEWNDPREASWHFDRAPSLAPQPSPAWREASASGVPAFKPVTSITEDFDTAPRLSLFPRVGGFRPEDNEEKDLDFWSAYMKYYTRKSGVVEGGGREGSAGLTLHSLPGVNFTAYFAPLAVKPSTTYRVGLWMASLMSVGEAAVGTMEYGAMAPTGKQFRRSFDERHLLKAESKVRVSGNRTWRKYTFSFRTSPETGMAHLLFSRKGKPDPAPVLVDDITVEEVPVSNPP